MDENNRSMCLNKKIMSTEKLLPEVHFANHIRPEPQTCWGWRTIPDMELLLIIGGTFIFEPDDDTALQAGPDEVLLIFPDERHRLQHMSGDAELSCIHCTPFPDMPETGLIPQRLTKIEPADPIKSCFLRCAETFARQSVYRSELLQTCSREIWLRLCEYRKTGSEQRTVPPRIQNMIDYLDRNLTRTAGRSDLAREFHLTPEHVNWLFKKELGISPGEYLIRERTRKAFFLLQENRVSVKEIAYATGFNDPFHFSKTFKKLYGIPPAKVRQFMPVTPE